MQLINRRIIITGGTSGIGLELVKILAANNDVIVIARDAEKLSQLALEFNRVITYRADLSYLNQVTRVADLIVERFDCADLLINNAAVQNTPTFTDDAFEYEAIDREVTTNFTSICCLTHRLLPLLLANPKASILNVNSGLALTPKTSSAVYCATKAALDTFSQSLRYQLEDTHVSVQQAFLELVDTGMAAGRGSNKMTAQQAALNIIQGIDKEILDHDFGKVKLLRFLVRFVPSVAHSIMKRH